jgi:hypothetical protein
MCRTQHLRYCENDGTWYPFRGACEQWNIGWFQLSDHPLFVTCGRCKRTKQYTAASVALTPLEHPQAPLTGKDPV